MSVTIINGGTQGLGEAVARKLVSQGADGLVLAGRSADRGEALASELTGLGTPTLFVQCDIAEPSTPQAIVEACDQKFGTVHGVVNVADATSRATLFTDTPEHFDTQMTVNVKAPYFLIQAAAKVMVRDGVHGSIVNVGSTAGYGGATKLTAYAMSKGALAIMTRNLAYGLMRHHIRVNQVNQGGAGYNNLLTDTRHTQITEIDFAGHARSMGCEAETVTTVAEFEAAFERARAADRTYVIAVKTTQFDWTEGGIFWEVGVPQVSGRQEVLDAHERMESGKQAQRLV
jgi:NAD(P)-dependent dehydrogenase (short-subunit alcohol dehydrogenase family)